MPGFPSSEERWEESGVSAVMIGDQQGTAYAVEVDKIEMQTYSCEDSNNSRI